MSPFDIEINQPALVSDAPHLFDGGISFQDYFPLAKQSAEEKKRSKNWLSYYAGYSEHFVRAAIDAIGLTESAHVLDPWGGSGTTGLVCQTLGVQSTLVDINPVVAHFSSARIGKSNIDEKTANKLRKLLLSSFENAEPNKSQLTDVFGKAANAVHSLKNIAPEFLAEQSVGSNRRAVGTALNSQYSIILAAILSAARICSGTFTGSNPTWPQAPRSGATRTSEVETVALDRLDAMLGELHEKSSGAKVSQFIANSASLPFSSNTFDAVITSPPYLTRIDYAMAMLPELICYFDTKDVRQLRSECMGTPAIRATQPQKNLAWGNLCLDVLSSVEHHQSYAAKNYYHKTMVQYFYDAYKSLKEIRRVLNKGGIALLVVQNSYFKDLEIPLAEIYIDMAMHHFGGAEIIARQPVARSLCNINSKARRHLHKRTVHEDIVAIYG